MAALLAAYELLWPWAKTYGKDPRPPLTADWSAERSGSTFQTKFFITDGGIYLFSIGFRWADRRQGLESLHELQKFTGNASYHRVTVESADTANPVEVPEYTPEEEEFLRQGGLLVSGKAFEGTPLPPHERWHDPPPGTTMRLTKVGTGVVIPLQIRLEDIGDPANPKVIVSKTIWTKGVAGGSDGELRRGIAARDLQSGEYRVTVTAIQDTAYPDGVVSAIKIGRPPKR